jgi:hypothetical protein
VLADVRQRLLDNPEQCEPLRRGQAVDVAGDGQTRLDLAALDERPDLPLEQVLDRLLDKASRLERLRELTERAIDLDDALVELVERGRDLEAAVVVDEAVDAPAHRHEVVREDDELLHRPVVEVVAKPRETPLARLDQRALVVRVPLEQHLPLEQRREPCCGDPERCEHERAVLVCGRRERRIRAVPAVDRDRVQRGALAHASLPCALDGERCERARALALPRVRRASDARRVPLEFATPERDPAHGREQLEEQELGVDRDRRRHLHEARLGRSGVEQRERGLSRRDAERPCERLDERVDCLDARRILERERAQRPRGEREARLRVAGDGGQGASVRRSLLQRGSRRPGRVAGQKQMELFDCCCYLVGVPFLGTPRGLVNSPVQVGEKSRRHRSPSLHVPLSVHRSECQAGPVVDARLRR